MSSTPPFQPVEMPSGAVFLSYASQNAEAARRITEALRAAGVEVWFDQSELRGGDAWDQKISKQIHECALFMPVISRHTQERREGYFRREWRLAADRLSDMAEDTPFVLPLCVDDTREREALVPAAFLNVQWTRLPGGETPAVFCERVRSLLAPVQPSAQEQPTVLAPTASPSAAQPPADIAPAKSIAVLAFANLSCDPENEYFSDGISEELLNVLAKIPGLRVVARTSAFSFKRRNVSVPEIARVLNVAYVVEGSVRKAGDRVRITAQLISAADGFHVWSESYDRRLEDIFAVQDEVAQTIVGQVRGRLMGAAADPAMQAEIQTEVQAASKGGTKNVEAYRLFLHGRHCAYQLTRESLAQAVDDYRQALEREPSFALAWAELAQAYVRQSGFAWSDLPLIQSNERARGAALRALALEPNLAEGHAALTLIRAWCDFDWAGAEESGRTALILAPANAPLFSSLMFVAFARDRVENAVELARRAVELDPVSAETHVWLMWALVLAGRIGEAETESRRAIELCPTVAWGYAGLGLGLLLAGRLDEALTVAEQETTDWSRLTVVAMVRWKQGQQAASDSALTALTAKWSAWAAYQVAEVYSYREEIDQAFAWLERAFTQRDSGMTLLKLDPFLRNLHGDPRWPVLLKKMRLDD